jgi:CheY-like chemotaxis protein
MDASLKTVSNEMTFAGKRVLVVEDDQLIAFGIVAELKSAGCTVLGPALSLEAAVTITEAQIPDAAVLDVFLNGTYVWPLAGMLTARAVPFIFLTGFGPFLEFPPAFAPVPRLEKPHRRGALRRELSKLLAHRRSASGVGDRY